jgi:aryl-alcohol dehydrogenase-like predicted oxidoreductase
VQIATKFGCLQTGIRGDPAYVRAACEESLKRLDVDCIDLYYQHRVDATVPIEITVGAMKKLVEEGKVKYIGLSEAHPADIRRAHAVHPITAVQVEWNLWCRELEEELVPTCRELGIGIVPYSPLGNGFFSGASPDNLHESDVRKIMMPRFAKENFAKNRAFFDRLEAIGSKKNCTPGKLALAWLQHQGNDVVPIPGTTKLKNFEANIKSLHIKLTKEEIKETEEAVPITELAGKNTIEQIENLTWKNRRSPPLSSWTGSQ